MNKHEECEGMTVETSENNFKNKEYNCESLIKNVRLILDRM